MLTEGTFRILESLTDLHGTKMLTTHSNVKGRLQKTQKLITDIILGAGRLPNPQNRFHDAQRGSECFHYIAVGSCL